MFKKDKEIVTNFLGEDILDFTDPKSMESKFMRLYMSKDYNKSVIILSRMSEEDENRRLAGYLYQFCEFRKSYVLKVLKVLESNHGLQDISVKNIDNNTVYCLERRVE